MSVKVKSNIAELVDFKTRELDSRALRDKLTFIDGKPKFAREAHRVLSRSVTDSKRFEFQSFEDFLSLVEQGERANGVDFSTLGYDCWTNTSTEYEEDWTNSDVLDIRGREHQLEIVDRGFTTQSIFDYYTNVQSRLESNPDTLEKLGSIGQDCRRKRRADLAGYLVNIDKAMSGIDPMESMKRNNQSMTVRFFIDLARLGDERPETVLQSSCVAVAVAKQLESRGYSTEIKFGTTNFSNSKDLVSCISFVGKRPDETINEPKMMTFSSASIFRDFIFSFRYYCLGFGGGMGASFYSLAKPEKNQEFFQEFTDSDVYIGYNDNLETIVTGVSGVLSD